MTWTVGAGQAARWPAGSRVRLAAPERIAGLHDGLLRGLRRCWVAAPRTRWLCPQAAGGTQPAGSPSPRARPAAAPARLHRGPDPCTSWQPKSRPWDHPVPRGCPASRARDCSPGPAAPHLHGLGPCFPSRLADPPPSSLALYCLSRGRGCWAPPFAPSADAPCPGRSQPGGEGLRKRPAICPVRSWPSGHHRPSVSRADITSGMPPPGPWALGDAALRLQRQVPGPLQPSDRPPCTGASGDRLPPPRAGTLLAGQLGGTWCVTAACALACGCDVWGGPQCVFTLHPGSERVHPLSVAVTPPVHTWAHVPSRVLGPGPRRAGGQLAGAPAASTRLRGSESPQRQAACPRTGLPSGSPDPSSEASCPRAGPDPPGRPPAAASPATAG